MTDQGSSYITTAIEPDDVISEFSCGKHPLDDYFRRHALANHLAGISRAYVLRRASSDVLARGTPMGRAGGPRSARSPRVLGFYTLSMALVESAQVAPALAMKLPMYPMPVALIGRLAVDDRERGQRTRLVLAKSDGTPATTRAVLTFSRANKDNERVRPATAADRLCRS